MKLTEKYIQYLNQTSWVVAEIPLLVPPAIVAYLFHPGIDYPVKLIITGFFSALITMFHCFVGVSAALKKDVKTAINFLILPISVAIFVIYLGFN